MRFFCPPTTTTTSVKSFVIAKGSRDVVISDVIGVTPSSSGPVAISDDRIAVGKTKSSSPRSTTSRTSSPHEPINQSTAATATTTTAARGGCCGTPRGSTGSSRGCSSGPAPSTTATTTVVAVRSCGRLPSFFIPADHPSGSAGFLAARTCRFCRSLPIGLLLLFTVCSTLRINCDVLITMLLLLHLSGVRNDVGSTAPNAPSERRSRGRSFGLCGQARLLRLCPGYLQGRLE